MMEQTKKNRVLNRMGAPRIDDRRSGARCRRNHRVPGHLASQEWPHRRRPLRSQLAVQS